MVELPFYVIPRTPGKPIAHGKHNAVVCEFLEMLSSDAGAMYESDEQIDRVMVGKFP